MSPEFTVVRNPKTRKGEIEVNLLPGEDAKTLRKEIMTAYVAQSNLKYEDGLYKGMKTLLKIFPQEIAKKFLLAVLNGDENASVEFEKIGPGKYKIIKENLKPYDKKSFIP